MARTQTYPSLTVSLNGHIVGQLKREAPGQLSFVYAQSWLDFPHTLPISLSMPLQTPPHTGEKVWNYFDNLLPDQEAIRRIVARKVAASGTDPYHLLKAIGSDCVGALQILSSDHELETAAEEHSISLPCSSDDLEKILGNLSVSPLGLESDDFFRISLAGFQEKTALARINNQWHKPLGQNPTTHIIKPSSNVAISDTILYHSVENEFLCLKVCDAFGLPTTSATIEKFGSIKALCVERFDRLITKDGRIIRLPQEDICQAFGLPSSLKYEADGGPSIKRIIQLLKTSDNPEQDCTNFIKAQLLFWAMAAIDGHAKNFSIFLKPNNGFTLTPLYDVISVQPYIDSHHLLKKKSKMAMAIGKNRHYVVDEIFSRHFFQTAKAAGFSQSLLHNIMDEFVETYQQKLDQVTGVLPEDFPDTILSPIIVGMKRRILLLSKKDDRDA
jgi:serine/threonine-protein kinase HipA